MTKTYKPKMKVGILGGMGPAATAEFYHLLVKCAQDKYSADQDTDFPAMFVYSLPLSGFDETGVCDESLVNAQLVAGIKELSKFDCGLICIPCNTVHLFLKEMQAATPIPIVSIIDSVVQDVVKAGAKKVGLLASETTRKTGLYEEALKKRQIEYISADDYEQKTINEVIHHVMSGTNDDRDTSQLLTICDRMEKEGAIGIVLGCTELPLALSRENSTLPMISSLESLAGAVLAHVYR